MEPKPLGRLGRFEIEAILGQGGMGTVYAGRDTDTGESVALKVLSSGLEDDEEKFRRFEQEVTALSRLDHENIVRLLGPLERDGDRVFFAMEILEGETLAKRLRRSGPLPVRKALDVARTLLTALGAAHQAGVVHRDVKPSNILLSGDDLKITDFGLARMEDITRLTRTGQLMGTLDYMSPEQCEGAPVDARTDLYSAGIILYEMLAGAPPFNRATAGTVLKGHLSEVPASLDTIRADLPDGLAAVVAKLLEKNPGDRFASAREAAEALDAVPDPSVTVTFHPGTGPGAPASAAAVTRAESPPARPRLGSPLLVGTLVVLFAAAVAGGISLLTEGGERPAPYPRGTVEETLASAHRALREENYQAFVLCFEPETLAPIGGADPRATFRRIAGEIDDFAYNLEVPPRGAALGDLSIRVGSSIALSKTFGLDPAERLQVGLRSGEGGFRIARVNVLGEGVRPWPGAGGALQARFVEEGVKRVFENLDKIIPDLVGRRVGDEGKLERLRERLKTLKAAGKIDYEILHAESNYEAGRPSIVVRSEALANLLSLTDDRFVLDFEAGRGARGGRAPRIRPLVR